MNIKTDKNFNNIQFAGSTSRILCASTATDEILYTISCRFGLTDIFEFYVQCITTSNANSKTFKAYFNTTPDLTGSPVLIATVTATTNFAAGTFHRRYAVRSTTSMLSQVAGATSLSTPYGNTTVLPAEITGLPDLTQSLYLIITGNRANGADTVGAEWTMLRINKTS